MKILHGLTGSVATTLSTKILEKYQELGQSVEFVYTESAVHFMKTHNDLGTEWNDSDEWYGYKYLESVLHIDLVKRCDKFIIAPCSANTLAKIANGLCDNLLTCCARAWDFSKPFVIAPAMNTRMWEHPITQKHIDTVKSWGIIVKEPVSKTLYCGDTGIGAMADINDILA